MVHDLAGTREMCRDRVSVPRGDRALEAGGVRRRAVRPDACADAERRLAATVGYSIHLPHAIVSWAGALDEHDGALGLPQLDGAPLLGVGLVAPAGGPE